VLDFSGNIDISPCGEIMTLDEIILANFTE
jgi:hypothetical protein